MPTTMTHDSTYTGDNTNPVPEIFLKCNGQTHPLILNPEYGPFFSWIYGEGFPDGFIQSAYRIQVSTSSSFGGELVWDSGKVCSGRQYMISYEGKKLEPLTCYYYKVAIWDGGVAEAVISPTGCFETGITGEMLKEYGWIGGSPVFRKEFELPDTVAFARAFATCVGYYEMHINGEKVGDQVLAPSHTDYEKRVEYQGYDVTAMLKKGSNAVGIVLGGGIPAETPFFVKEPFALVLLYIELTNGEKFLVSTDETWMGHTGAIVENSVYKGEIYDARLEIPGWDMAGFSQRGLPAKIFPAPGGKLVPQILPPIRKVGDRKAALITKQKDGSYVADFSQNLTGWVRLKASGKAGIRITVRYAELLNEDGSVNQKNLRIIGLEDVYIMKGAASEIYEPRFTYHGFRYAQIEGYPGQLTGDDISACIVHSDVEEAGSFQCSDELYNRIHSAMKWTVINNLHSIPTDCPQRNERRGWMADAHISSDAAICNYDMHWFYRKWMDDLLDVTDEETGEVLYSMAPRWVSGRFFPWFAAIFIIPWNLYKYYDDKDILERTYSRLKKTLDFFTELADGNTGLLTETGRIDSAIRWDSTFDDWLALDRTRNIQVINGYYYYEICIMEEIAETLGFEEDKIKFAGLRGKIKESYNNLFLSPDRTVPVMNGYYGSAYNISQFGQALPLSLGMVPDDVRQTAFDNLLWDVLHARGSAQLSTGILGTKCVLNVLTEFKRNDIIAQIFSREDFPGWGFMIRNGATTVWERWHRLEGAEMDSHDHPALAAPDTWFYRQVAGIGYAGFDADGRRIFRITPYTPDHVNSAEARCRTPWGTVSVQWERKGNQIRLNVAVPSNTFADIRAGENTTRVESGKISMAYEA